MPKERRGLHAVVGILLAAGAFQAAVPTSSGDSPSAAGESGVGEGQAMPGSAYLALLPDGEMKRRFILDCTGCHVWTADWVRGPNGEIPEAGAWSVSIRKMIDMFGQGTGFPIISSWPDPDVLGSWLERYLSAEPAAPVMDPDLLPTREPRLTEFALPEPMDLPHDLMVDPEGQVLITGMFTHRMYRLDPEGGLSRPCRPLGLPAHQRWSFTTENAIYWSSGPRCSKAARPSSTSG